MIRDLGRLENQDAGGGSGCPDKRVQPLPLAPPPATSTARSIAPLVVVLLWAAGTSFPSCTLAIDRSPAQCHTDGDCKGFGFHPYCQNSSLKPCRDEGNCVCVDSKLKPEHCFFGTPVTPEDFLNQCSLGALPGDSNGPLGQCLSYSGVKQPMAMAKTPIQLAPPTPPTAGAAPLVLCKNLAPPGGRVLYMSGSSNFPPLLEKVAPAISKSLADQGSPPITPVFKTTTSCAGVQSVYPDQTRPATTPATYYAARVIHDLTSPTDNYPQYFDPATGKLASCSLGPAGAVVDVGESEIFAETCGLARNDIDVAETPGPKLAILFVAPLMTDQKVISAEAAREVFGVGGVDPWIVPQSLYIRGAGTATQQLVSRAIGVPSDSFWGIDQGTAQALALNLGSVTYPPLARQAIGILGADFYDRYSGILKALGFQANSQDCAYTPDTNSNLAVLPRDKINLRDGHYPIWGSVHLFRVLVDGQSPTDVINFVNLFGTPRLPVEMLDAFIAASFVPNCAMMVRRDAELGPLVSAAPAVSCGCHFDSRVNAAPGFVPPGCTPCATNGDCTQIPGKPECIYGFCEIASQ